MPEADGGHLDIVEHAHILEQAASLKRSRYTRPPEIIGLPAGGVLAVEQHSTEAWALKSGETVHQRRFAGTVGPDEAEHLVPLDGQTDFGKRSQSLEVNAQAFNC